MASFNPIIICKICLIQSFSYPLMYSNFNRVTFVLGIMASKPQVFGGQFLLCFNFECLVSQSCYSKTPGSTWDQLDINMAIPMRSPIWSIDMLHNGVLVSATFFPLPLNLVQLYEVLGLNIWSNCTIVDTSRLKKKLDTLFTDISKAYFQEREVLHFVWNLNEVYSQGPVRNESVVIQDMACTQQAISHYLSQCSASFLRDTCISPKLNELTHLPLVPHIFVSELGQVLVQIMACHLFGNKPLPEPILAFCQLDSWEQISVKFKSEFYHFHSRKCIWNCRLPKWRPFCPGRWVNPWIL